MPADQPKPDWGRLIRPGLADDLDALADIERDANLSLVEAGAFPESDGSVTPRHLLEAAIGEGLLFVATDDRDRQLGFLAAGERDGGLFIGEVDVARPWQRLGIGRALILAALLEARRRSLWGAMLTTDRHAPFNRPFYEKLGFVETARANLPASLAALLDAEIVSGLDPARRLGMVLRFAET